MQSPDKKDAAPEWYRDFSEFRTSVESRMARLEAEMAFTKQVIGDLRSSIDEVRRSVEDLKLGVQNFMIQVGESRRKDIQALFISVVSGTAAATVLAYLIRFLMGA